MENHSEDSLSLFDSISCGIYFQDADGTRTAVNQAALEMLGLTREQFLGRMSLDTAWQMVREDGTPFPPEHFPPMVALRSGEKVTNVVAGVFNPQKGGVVWLRIDAQPLFRPGEPAPHQAAVTLNDITELKRTLDMLKDSEEKFAKAFNYSPALMAISTIEEGRYLEVNDRFCEATHLSRQDVIGRTSIELGWMTDSSRQRMKEALLRDGLVNDMEIQLTRPDGTTFYCLFSAGPVTIGNDRHLLTIALDVTERRQTEIALRLSEERYRTVVESQTEFIDRYLPDGTLTFANKALSRFSGIPENLLLGTSFFQYVAPEERAGLRRALAALTPASPTHEADSRIILNDGSTRWHHWTNTALFDDEGTLKEFQGVGRDITEQRLAEQARENYAAQLRIALEAAHAGTWDWEIPTGRVSWSREFFHLIGLDPNTHDASLSLWQSIIHPEDVDEALRTIKAAIDDRHELVNDYRIIMPNGSIRWISALGRTTYDEGGAPLRMSGICIDITDRKRIETSLRESEEKYRKFIDTANEGIGITDHDYTITFANVRLAEMLGYEPAELVGMPVICLLAGEEAASFATQMDARRHGLFSRRECRHQRKDGSPVWLFVSSTPITAADGTFQGCFAMFTDLSGRKAAEDALRQAHDELELRVEERTAALATANEMIRKMTFELVSAEERERGRIAGELHDQVGQALLLAKMKQEMLASELADSAAAATAGEVVSLLERSIDDIRTLTFRLRPPVLATAGIDAALEWLCRSIGNDYPVQVDFSADPKPKPLASEARYSLYQAVRELLLNVVRHAGVPRARLTVTRDQDTLVVQVDDEGVGFDQSSIMKKAGVGGFGLYNVRQRLEQIGGTMSIATAPGSGTSVTVQVPLAGG